uniref:Uncharacterized protein n=1 Tax=Rhizophora mucronata TaxID=61149 RepID=A0A2P2IUI4_RHIMU
MFQYSHMYPLQDNLLTITGAGPQTKYPVTTFKSMQFQLAYIHAKQV